MRKGSDVIGKAIVAYDTGERFSRVKDLLFDQDTNQLLALLVDEGGLFSGKKVIPFEHIQAIGLDAVVVPSEQSVIRARDVDAIHEVLRRNNILRGTHIMTTDGQNLGKMIDLYFNEQTGAIEGYEVSGGLFADAYSGRSFVPTPQTLKIGEHVAFVPPEVSALMEEQVGGIKGAMQAAGAKVQATAQSTSETLQSAAETANYRLQEAGRATVASVTNVIVEPAEQKSFAIGKIAQQDVQSADGLLVVAQGQIITAPDAEVAEEKGVLDQLYRSAGGSPTQKAGERLQSATNHTNERLRSAASQFSTGFDQLKRDTSVSMTNAVVSPSAQKEYVVGKIAEWSVAVPDGRVLVTSGQIVTELMAEMATQQGVLPELYRATGGRLSNELSQRSQGIAARYSVEQAIGRRAQNIVRNRDGFIIAAPGQIVTPQVVERAKLYRKEQELLNSVGLSANEAVRARANSTASLTGDRIGTTAQQMGVQLQYGAEQAKVNARTLWEQVKEVASDLQERSAQAIEERRIKGAIGRPVTRVILDRQDTVILNVGDLITHQAIETARFAGVLDVLLGSVYGETPQLSASDLRAPQHGQASLEVSK